MRAGGGSVDVRSHEVWKRGKPLRLPPNEYEILLFFLENPGRVFSSAEIYEKVWKDVALGNESTVAVHIRHLREKLNDTLDKPKYIKTIWGVGYKIEGQ